MTLEKKEIRGSLIFWGKRFGRLEKKYLGLGQPRIILNFFCIDQDYLFFLLATVRPIGWRDGFRGSFFSFNYCPSRLSTGGEGPTGALCTGFTLVCLKLCMILFQCFSKNFSSSLCKFCFEVLHLFIKKFFCSLGTSFCLIENLHCFFGNLFEIDT